MGFFGGDTSPLKGSYKSDMNTANQLGAAGQTVSSELLPFLHGELNAQHSINPMGINEMLTAAEAPQGQIFGDAGANMQRLAARTGNATTLTKSMDELAREREKAAAGVSEGIAAQDVLGANANRQNAAQGLQGLYGTDVSGQLSAMGQASDSAKQIAAQPGMFGQIMSGIGAGVSAATGLGSMGAFGGGMQKSLNG